MADTPELACQYFLIRLAPDPVRNDRVTVGVALMHPASGFADVRINLDPRRVRLLGAHFVPDDLAGLEDDLRRRLRAADAATPAWASAGYLLALAAESFSHSLQFTPPTLVLTADPAHELERLFQRYAATPEAPARAVAGGVRQLVLRHLREVFAEERVLPWLRRDVVLEAGRGEPDPYRFDFHYRTRDTECCIQALPLERDTESIRAACYATAQLRAALRSQGRALDLAAFAETLEFSGEARPTQHRAMLEAAGIRVLALGQAAAEAGHIRARLNHA